MRTILIQLDTDARASSFDRVVAVDAGVDELFNYANVTADNVEPLVHGAMFTRGPKELQNTAIFVGGTDVAAAEKIFERVCKTFFGPLRVSVMMDASGSNTTAAAAVLAARKHLTLAKTPVLVLGATGPVGLRVTQLLAMEGAQVRAASRSIERAQKTCDAVQAVVEGAVVTPCETSSAAGRQEATEGVELIVAAGAAGAQLLSAEERRGVSTLKVAVDLNAVPPSGLEGVEVTDKAVEHDGAICYGAIGVGGTKMKIHKMALRKLFEKNDQVLDTGTIYALGENLA